MIPAYHGDATLRSDVIARLRRHAAAGTLSFGATKWDGISGSTLGIAAESEDSRDYAARFGHPLALAGLLDPIVALNHAGAPDTAIAWHESVLPGSDLSGVPLAILSDLLNRLGAPTSASECHAKVVAMHREEAGGETVARAAWTKLRSEIEGRAASTDGPTKTALHACALACWPLTTSRSVLVGLVHAWTSLPPPLSPDFSDEDRRQANTILQGLWDETQPRRALGEAVHMPSLFRTRYPELSARFEADMARTNAHRTASAAQAQHLVLRHLANAGTI